MKNLDFPCIVVTKKSKESEDFMPLKNEKDFIKWSKDICKNDNPFFAIIESINDVERYVGRDSRKWTESLKKARFPLVYVVDEKDNVTIKEKKEFSEGDLWFDVLKNEFSTCIGLCSEDEANDWAKSSDAIKQDLACEMEWLGWKIKK